MWNYQKQKKSKTSITQYEPSSFHLKRVDAQLTPYDKDQNMNENQPTEHDNLRVFLNDIKSTGLQSFSQSPVQPGTLVRLTLLYDKPFYCKAKIIGCHEYLSDSKIISEEEKFKFRITLEFFFENDLEEQRIKNFVKEITAEEIIRKSK